MFSQICICGCGSEPEKDARGQYLPFAKGHEDPGVAAAYRAQKKALLDAKRKALALRNHPTPFVPKRQIRANVQAPSGTSVTPATPSHRLLRRPQQ